MCERMGMEKPGVKELADAVNISKSYACEILGTDNTPPKNPSRSLAIHIYRKTGWRHSMLDGLTDEQLDVLEAVDPWTPTRAAA